MRDLELAADAQALGELGGNAPLGRFVERGVADARASARRSTRSFAASSVCAGLVVDQRRVIDHLDAVLERQLDGLGAAAWAATRLSCVRRLRRPPSISASVITV